MEFKLTDELTDYILRKNEGYRETTSLLSNEHPAQNHYVITDGKLYCHTVGDTIDEINICSPRKTKMFLRSRRSLIYLALKSRS